MRLIDDEPVKEPLREVTFDELTRLVIALTKRKLRLSQLALNAFRLSVVKHKLPVFIKQVNQLVDVVRQCFRQHALTHAIQ